MAAESVAVPRRVLILGHSYVRRLEEFINHSNSSHINRNFTFEDSQFQIFFSGYGGAGIARIHEVWSENLHKFRPHAVILQIGSNDIGRGFNLTKVPALCSRIISLAQRIQNSYSVEKVLISQLFFRNRARCPIFNECTQAVNYELQARLVNSHTIAVWKHRNFWKPEVRARIENRDQIHFNDEGNLKYYNSLKGAILHSV